MDRKAHKRSITALRLKMNVFAKFIQAELRTSLENTNRSAKTISHVYLLKYSKTPGALIEAGFYRM